jgi:hypothetical protein
MSLLQDEVKRALGDNPLSVEAEGAAVERARMVLELNESQKPSLWDILNKHDERQRALILTLKAENAVLEAQLKWCQQELLKQAQQGCVNVLNAALAGIETQQRPLRRQAGLESRRRNQGEEDGVRHD